MAQEPENQDVSEYKLKERLRRFDFEITGNLAARLTGRITEDNLNKLFDEVFAGWSYSRK